MRGVHTFINDIRRQVFTEVARLAFEGGDYAKAIEHLPHKIIPGEVARHRQNIFLERAIVSERLRLAIGLPLREMDEYAPPAPTSRRAPLAEKYYEPPPLINIINFACNACPHKQVRVTNMCQGCLAHPCMEVCPKDAISTGPGQELHRPGEVHQVRQVRRRVPLRRHHRMERPCAEACGMDAIGSDELGRAKIDYDKCVSCGMCLVNCPFGAIADKSQIFQVIQAISRGDKVIAAVAPPLWASSATRSPPPSCARPCARWALTRSSRWPWAPTCAPPRRPRTSSRRSRPSSPSWLPPAAPPGRDGTKVLPPVCPYISMALTPMVLTARLSRKGASRRPRGLHRSLRRQKLEASRRTIRSDVDFVLTFEECRASLTPRVLFPRTCPSTPMTSSAPAPLQAVAFAVTGGVAAAVKAAIKEIDPDREVLVEHADGLRECRKMLLMAKTGKYNGYLLEGMGCPGGCVAGAGTITPVKKSTAAVTKYTNDAPSRASPTLPLSSVCTRSRSNSEKFRARPLAGLFYAATKNPAVPCTAGFFKFM